MPQYLETQLLQPRFLLLSKLQRTCPLHDDVTIYEVPMCSCQQKVPRRPSFTPLVATQQTLLIPGPFIFKTDRRFLVGVKHSILQGLGSRVVETSGRERNNDWLFSTRGSVLMIHYPGTSSGVAQGAGAAARAAFSQKQQQQQHVPVVPTPPSSEIQAKPTLVSAQAQRQRHGENPSDTYDISSYDHLQDHAFQLSASAGYTPAPIPGEQPLAPMPVTQQAHSQAPLQPQQQQQQQVYYYPPQQPGIHYAPGHAPAVAAPPGQQVYVPTPQSAPVAPSMAANPVQPQQFCTMQPTAIPLPPYGQPQGAVPPTPHLASRPAASSSGVNPAQPAGVKRPFPGVSSPNRQLQAYAGAPVAPVIPPQLVPSASSAAFDDDEIDPILRQPPANFATMSAEEKRRYERNIREQQRSFKISQQIKELRTVLTESSIPFKPNKFSILMCVVDYVKQLQSRAIMLDAEHRKLIDTIKQTTDMANAGQTPSPDEDKSKEMQPGAIIGNDAEMLFVQGLDYNAVFQQCSAALSVAALDGRIIACNDAFAAISGFSRSELLRRSIFNLMNNHEDVFRAMGEMLSSTGCIAQPATKDTPPMYWSGVVNQKSQSVSAQDSVNACPSRVSSSLTPRSFQLFMNITLTRSKDGIPKFFNCALTAT